jgi:putative tryptophan/tyrosine transport system substrate-binding protein
MMDRRRFLQTSLAGALAAPLAAGAQEMGKMWRVGILRVQRHPTPEEFERSPFIAGMRELGYVEGQNVVYERRFVDGHLELLPSRAAELVESRVNVIVAVSSPATRAAKDATAKIPIVFTDVSQPVRQGLVVSLTRPGGNLTGFADIAMELMPKRLDLLKELLPRATRIAVLMDPEFQPSHMALDESRRAARTLGLRLETFEIARSTDLDATFARIRQSRSEALILIPAPLFFVLRIRIAELAIKNRLPLVAEVPQQAEVGALLVYNSNQAQMYRGVARYVDHILKGARPADLPVQEPTTFDLILNVKTAKAIGLTIPPSLLARADQVIE